MHSLRILLNALFHMLEGMLQHSPFVSLLLLSAALFALSILLERLGKQNRQSQESPVPTHAEDGRA